MTYVKEYGSISTEYYSNIVPNVDERTLRRGLNSLVKKGLLIIVGKTKGRKYKLIE